MDLILRRAPAGAARARRFGRPGRLTYLTLAGVILFSAFPLYWSVVVASQTNEAIGKVPPAVLPGPHLWRNAVRVLQEDSAHFLLALRNSVIVAGSITLSVIVTSTLAGFAFAKLRFRGRQALFLAVVATMMVPTQLGIIPLYMLMTRIGWTNRLPAVIVPAMVSAFGVFFMRQYLSEALPDELLEAGRVDGCSTLRLVWHVVLPAARPAAAVLGLLTFMQAWNDFFWPKVVLTPENPTIQVSISALASGYQQDFSLVLAGTALGTAPLLLVFALLGKQIIGGIMQGAVKG